MLDKKIRSIGYALKGLRLAWREEFNFRLEIAFGICAVLLGIAFHLSAIEWLFVIGAIGIVLSAEALNTALEELCDMLRPTHDSHVGKIKDLAAAGVFLASVSAAIIGVIIFIPHMFRFL
ncbi:diacylglycerol kinase family protein [Candidatus Kaiserbacteria bacterium]|nr:diacylglycerol kinase family protein [Candidatus Kaiserbacteria bacterium]